MYQGTTLQLAELFKSCGNSRKVRSAQPTMPKRFVSGHNFSCAEKSLNTLGFSPCCCLRLSACFSQAKDPFRVSLLGEQAATEVFIFSEVTGASATQRI